MKRKQRRFRMEELESRQMLTVVPEFVADIRPGLRGAFTGFEVLHIYNDELYFSANDGDLGNELWKSDGTEAGTQLVKDIHVGDESKSSHPGWFIEYEGELFFSAIDAQSGDELWKTDGTSGGTQRVVDIYPGDDDGRPSEPFLFKDQIIFSSSAENGTELWRTDGSASGTEQIKDIREGERDSLPGNYSGFYEFKDKVYFTAEANDVGQELWRTDGTADGTEMVIDAESDGDSWPTNFFEYRGDLYFTAEIFSTEFGEHFAHLFRVDGESETAEQVLEMPLDLDVGVVVVGDWMYFAALDSEVGFELFRSDGTEAGTTVTRDIMRGELDSDPRNLFVSDGKVYFAAGETRDPETGRTIENLWVTDGTAFGTRKVSPEPILGNHPFVEYRGDVYYTAFSEELGWELFKTNGNLSSTVVHDVNPDANDSFAIPKTVFEDQLLFLAENINAGREIWTYDGESAEMVDIALGGGNVTEDPINFEFVEYGNDLVFMGSTPFEGLELFIIRSAEIEQPERLAGDANEDGMVNFADFLVLSGNFGAEDATWNLGDFDGDGRVAFSDFLILSGNFGASVPPPPAEVVDKASTEVDAFALAVDSLFTSDDDEKASGVQEGIGTKAA